MKLSRSSFSRQACKFKQPGKIDIEGTMYTYESKNDLYDIVIIGGMKYYQKNGKGYSNRIDSIEMIHYAIEKHYNI